MAGTVGRFLRVSTQRNRPLKIDRLVHGRSDPRSITVIDLAVGALTNLPAAWEAINEIPDRLAGSRDLVFIWPTLTGPSEEADAAALVELFLGEAFERTETLGRPLSTSMLRHRFGADPAIRTVGGDSPVRLSERVRSLTVAGLMAEGGVVMTPSNHHFQLPSGRHARSFVRLANAFRSPRDIWSVAAWLASRLEPDVGIVTDTTTLAPLVAQLSSFAQLEGCALGPSVVLDRYPRSYLDVAEATQHAASFGKVLACLSVDASGTTSDYFIRALETYAAGKHSLDVIIRPTDRARPTPYPDGARYVWHEIDAETGASTISTCADCASPQHAHVVRIDERTFLPIAEPLPLPKMPDIGQSANADFWELASLTAAVRPESPTANADMSRAERTPMAIRIDFERLTANTDLLAKAVERRLRVVSGDESDVAATLKQAEANEYVHKALIAFRSATVIVCNPRESELETSIRETLQLLGVATDRLHFGAAHLEAADLSEDLTNVGCFTLGTVTGSSLKDLRVEVSDAAARLGKDVRIHGFCLHARPPSFTEWAAVRNPFKPELCSALWLSWLPWRSALRAEYELLGRLAPADATALQNRRAWLGDPDDFETLEYEETAFWGANDRLLGQRTVRGRSLYGYELEPNTVLAAVGAAIHTQRLRHDTGNSAQRFMVDIPRATRSYFDALLLAAIVRWATPGEAWWGRDPDEAAETMLSLLRHGVRNSADMTVIYPEMLVAALLGKVPPSAVQVLLSEYARVKATPIRPDSDTPDHVRQERFAAADSLVQMLRDVQRLQAAAPDGQEQSFSR